MARMDVLEDLEEREPMKRRILMQISLAMKVQL